MNDKKHVEDEISRLEKSLEAAFRPVAPRPEYKAYLHDRLVVAPSELSVPVKRPAPGYIILAAVGLMGSLILLITAIKALVLFSQARRSQVHPRSM